MRRREFISLFGGTATSWALPARAQQAERIRVIGVLHGGAEKSQIEQARNAALLQGLRQLGWIEGRNAKIDYRFGEGNSATLRKHAAELVALAPDVIASGAISPRRRCCGRPVACRSCLRLFLIRSVPVSSRAWRGPVGTLLALCRANTT